MEACLNRGSYNKDVAGKVALGSSKEVWYAVAEWVTGALRNNLVGLPLDLGALNIARGRETGAPTLNEASRQFFDATKDSTPKPYDHWTQFPPSQTHPQSIGKIRRTFGP